MKNKPIMILAIVLLAVVTLRWLFPSETEVTEERVASKKEQVLKVAESELPGEPDIAKATDIRSQTLLAQIYEGLYVFTQTKDVREGLAKSISTSEDGKTHTIKLREAVYQDGTPVTAGDFVDSFRRVASNEAASPYGFLFETFLNGEDVNDGKKPPSALGVEAPDDETLIIKLSEPVTSLPELLAMPAFYPQAQASDWTELKTNGPFAIEKMESDGYTLSKNMKYHQQKIVELEKITGIVITEAAARTEAFSNGEVDLVSVTSEMDDKKIDPIYEKARSGVFFLKFNTENEQMKNADVRRAIAAAVAGKRDELELSRGEKPTDRFVVTGRESFSAEVEAGDGWKDRGDEPLRLTLLNFDDAKAKLIGEQLKEQLEAELPGIEIALEPASLDEKVKREATGDFALALSGWMPDSPGPVAYLNQFSTGNPLNVSKYSSKAFDDALAKGKAAVDEEERYEAFEEAERILLEEDAIIVPLYQNAEAVALQGSYRGLTLPVYGPEYQLRTVKKME